MKFGKRLQKQIEVTLPEWRDKFLTYKDLKKLVRLISVVPPAAGPEAGEQPGSSKAEAEFIYLLNEEIEKFNAFFLEQEEDFIIRQKELKDRVQDVVDTVGPSGSQPSEAEYCAEISKIRRDVVDFHGEMVLLENYSNINYTGLAKILKKYDKRTGHLLRLPFIEKVLKQPFFTTDLISKLVKECESTIDAVFPVTEKKVPEIESNKETECAQGGRKQHLAVSRYSIYENTVAALATMRDLRGKSSTVGHFSLPPLNLPDADIFQSLQPPSPITT